MRGRSLRRQNECESHERHPWPEYGHLALLPIGVGPSFEYVNCEAVSFSVFPDSFMSALLTHEGQRGPWKQQLRGG